MRSSVICKDSKHNFMAFVKGSPERIKELCISQIPTEYDTVLEQYTKEGYRVIALANKELKKFETNMIPSIRREEIESNLTFLGFLVMENRLKPESTKVLKDL